MSNPIIQVKKLSKQYHIGLKEKANRTFRETLMDTVAAPIRNLKNLRKLTKFDDQSNKLDKANVLTPPDTIWALKDLSFEVQPGEVVGIIGKNGAGKSTLLKILSRITDPTSGEAKLYGRVASMLEVGTGFHPELTGRENIYMSGTILGMRKLEIDRKLNEIIAFSEIEKFIDTPVKRYSSGMYVRLAFAVAAHLDPEILLVDEVLAVGDASFQKKCLKKMNDVARDGRTVLFVSHTMAAIVSLCSRCMTLSNGELIDDGASVDVTSRYQTGIYSQIDKTHDLNTAERYGNGKARFTSLTIMPLGQKDEKVSTLQVGHDIEIEATLMAYERIVGANTAVIIYDTLGYRVIDVNTALKNSFLTLEPGQKAHVKFILRNVLLRPATYLIGLWLGRPNVEDIDGITYARSFSMNIDPRETRHHQIFPGVYQCEFAHSIDIDQNGS